MRFCRLMRPVRVFLGAIIMALGGLFGVLPCPGQSADSERTAIAVEALSRLEGVDIHQNPALKNAVMNVLESTRGTSSFVKLVKQFNLTNQVTGMLEYAIEHPRDETGVEAMSWVLDSANLNLIRDTLQGTNVIRATRAAEAMGNTGDKRTVGLLTPLLTADKSDLALRKQAVRSMARTSDGAQRILEAAQQDKLPDDLKMVAGMELAAVRWEAIRTVAADVLPPPQGGDARPLPSMNELMTMNGNPVRGAEIFKAEGPNCSNCHRAQGIGTDVGPDLSGIGTKLGKDALFDSILDPSAGISFGYEAFDLELKSGDEAFGLIVSETGEEVAIKDTRGIVTRHRKSDIVGRRQMKLSIMPAGLHMTMTTQELVDLVAYLASLKGP